ncbi:hypothetical protein [Actinacidiphila oryziradicis]|uniref:Uncharacterized protein n=1 Tax=Actinacidiphila oryziradicis TaxID=2571141 RepID=A0A4U0S1H4_9ACTN|nr:hypothetical protein [Actinacidiphila oryziradicis]TKA01973.1 hypothetical protein FCI23_39560 [Actinacidiphila oryziradicis]
MLRLEVTTDGLLHSRFALSPAFELSKPQGGCRRSGGSSPPGSQDGPHGVSQGYLEAVREKYRQELLCHR